MGRGSSGVIGGLRRRRASQKGYTIVELSIAVAIAGVLTVGAIGLVQNVLQTNRANETSTSLVKALGQIDKVWADQTTYAGLNLATAAAAGVFQGMQITPAGAGGAPPLAVTSRFNRPVYLGLAPNIPTAGSNRGYALTFAAVPASVCADLVTAAASGGVRGIIITPEANVNATAAALIPAAMDAAGVLTPPAAGVHSVALDASSPTVNVANALGVNGCGTANATVALTFVNWK